MADTDKAILTKGQLKDLMGRVKNAGGGEQSDWLTPSETEGSFIKHRTHYDIGGDVDLASVAASARHPSSLPIGYLPSLNGVEFSYDGSPATYGTDLASWLVALGFSEDSVTQYNGTEIWWTYESDEVETIYNQAVYNDKNVTHLHYSFDGAAYYAYNSVVVDADDSEKVVVAWWDYDGFNSASAWYVIYKNKLVFFGGPYYYNDSNWKEGSLFATDKGTYQVVQKSLGAKTLSPKFLPDATVTEKGGMTLAQAGAATLAGDFMKSVTDTAGTSLGLQSAPIVDWNSIADDSAQTVLNRTHYTVAEGARTGKKEYPRIPTGMGSYYVLSRANIDNSADLAMFDERDSSYTNVYLGNQNFELPWFTFYTAYDNVAGSGDYRGVDPIVLEKIFDENGSIDVEMSGYFMDDMDAQLFTMMFTGLKFRKLNEGGDIYISEKKLVAASNYSYGMTGDVSSISISKQQGADSLSLDAASTVLAIPEHYFDGKRTKPEGYTQYVFCFFPPSFYHYNTEIRSSVITEYAGVETVKQLDAKYIPVDGSSIVVDDGKLKAVAGASEPHQITWDDVNYEDPSQEEGMPGTEGIALWKLPDGKYLGSYQDAVSFPAQHWPQQEGIEYTVTTTQIQKGGDVKKAKLITYLDSALKYWMVYTDPETGLELKYISIG